MLSQLSQSHSWRFALTMLSFGFFYLPLIPVQAQTPAIEVLSSFPRVIEGRSGGTLYDSECGYMSEMPTYHFRLPESIGGILTTVEASEAGADMTLMIQGPDGRVCIDDTGTSLMPEYGQDHDTVWPQGDYQVWVGDWGDSRNFSLRFTQN